MSETNNIDKVSQYLLFGALAFSTAGLYGVAAQIDKTFFEIFIQADTWYYFLTLFLAFLPITTLSSFIKEGRFSNLGGCFFNSLVYSYIALGAISSVNSISITFGTFGNLFLITLSILYIASIISVKITKTV